MVLTSAYPPHHRPLFITPLTLATSCDHTANHQERLTWTLKSLGWEQTWKRTSKSKHVNLSENDRNCSVERNCHYSWIIFILTRPHLFDHISLTKLILATGTNTARPAYYLNWTQNQPWHAICCPKPTKAQTKVLLHCYSGLWYSVCWQTRKKKGSLSFTTPVNQSVWNTQSGHKRRACSMNQLSLKCVEFLFKQSKRLLSTYWIVLL